jgi:excisionase family DNA binding protein
MPRTSDQAAGAPRLLRLPEVAERLDVSVDTVRRRIADGRLKAMRSGRVVRVDERDLQAFIKASRRWR